MYFGDLTAVGAYAYSGAECFCGDDGSTSFVPGGATNLFFVIAGNNGAVEGSFGRDALDTERPEASLAVGCDLPQELTASCD